MEKFNCEADFENDNQITGKFNWLSTIKTNILMLRITGFWPEGETYKCDLYACYSATAVALFLVADVLTGMIKFVFLLNDIQAAVTVLSTMATKLAAGFKVYYIIKNMRLVKYLMKVLMSDIFQPKNTIQRKLAQKNLDSWTIIFKVLSYAIIGTVFFFSIYPLVDGFYKKYRLPFEAWYPYSVKKSPIYEITYVYQVVCTAYIATVDVNVDTLIGALNTFVSAQIDLLCDNLRNLHVLGEGESAHDKMIRCIKHHKQILRFAEKSHSFYSLIIFFQFFVSAFVIGLNLFELTVVVPFSSEFYSFLCYQTGALVEIFLLCWFGNEVQIKSEHIPYAVFESDWINFSSDVKKKINFFVTRCQKPLKISALNLFYLSLETFLKILRSAYSYFAFLHQVNN